MTAVRQPPEPSTAPGQPPEPASAPDRPPPDPYAPPSEALPPPGNRKRTGLVAAAVLVVLLLVAGLVVAVSTRGGGTPDPAADRAAKGTSAGARELAGRDTAIQKVLDRRAEAVLDRDRAAFMADIDTANKAFVAAQEQLFDNLSKVDFAGWEYELIGEDYNRPDLADAYDRPYHLPALLLHYAIKGFDRAEVARPQVLTFIKAGKRWLIASDSDADDQLPETGHADPWDRRPVVAKRGRSVLVIADAVDKGQLGRLVRVGDAAVRRVAGLWPDGWRRRVVIVAVRDQQLVETYFRSSDRTSENVAAIAVPAFDTVPGWTKDSGEHEPLVARSRVILNPRYFDATDRRNADLLTHEVTHVATQSRTFPGAPAWLAEGAAEFTAYRYLQPFALRLPKGLARQVAAGSVELPTYDFYNRSVSSHYVAGFLACAYINDEYGSATLRRVYRVLGRNMREVLIPKAQRRVFRQVLDTTPAQFSRDLADYAQAHAR
jgi:hypothetical protein